MVLIFDVTLLVISMLRNKSFKNSYYYYLLKENEFICGLQILA